MTAVEAGGRERSSAAVLARSGQTTGEDCLALVQLILAGLREPGGLDELLVHLESIAGSAAPTIRNLVDDLRTEGPPGADGVLAAAARAAHSASLRERAEAVADLNERAAASLPPLWDWLMRRRDAAGTWQAWWGRAAGSTSTLAWMAAPRRGASAAAAVRRWGRTAGEPDPMAAPSWRWLQTGAFLSGRLPAYRSALTAVVRAFRQRGLLPPSHRVTVVAGGQGRSVAIPIRVPGRSVLVVPATGSAADLQYLHHELAHVAEHATRSPSLPLDIRWSFDPVRSEGWALLCESLVQDPGWLTHLSLDPVPDELVSFYRAEEEFTRIVTDGRVELDGEVDRCSDAGALLLVAADVTRRLELDWHPAAFVSGVPNASQWRAYAAGYEWRDKAVAILEGSFGSPWWVADASWVRLAEALAVAGSAEAALRILDGSTSR